MDRASQRGRHPAEGEGGAFEYRLQRTPVGTVVLDEQRRILSLNPVAQRLLSRDPVPLFGVDILELHPQSARAKVKWLIDSAREAEDGQASLLVTTPLGSLVAKVTRLQTAQGDGFCMMFHSLGALPMGEGARIEGGRTGPDSEESQRVLVKLPLSRGSGDVTSLIDVEQVVCLSAQGHYAEARTLQFTAFCPRSLADLERRLDARLFLRVHRRHLVNLRHIVAAERSEGRWFLLMADQAATRLPVGRDKVALVRQLLAV